MSVLPVGFGASGSTTYQIANSIRLDGVDDYLSRTFGTPTLNTKFYLSCKLKRAKLGVAQTIISSYNGDANNFASIYFDATDHLVMSSSYGGTLGANFTTNAVFRDPTAWLLLEFLWDGSLSGNAKTEVWVNGVKQTSSSSNGSATVWHGNTAVTNRIGVFPSGANQADCYMADIFAADGQSLTLPLCGETNADGVWVPKAYTGSYGNNGFHLDFSDGTSTTTLGYDAAGSNDWTLSGMTRAAGVSDCWMVDTPTDNFATLNSVNKGSSVTLAVGNLNYTTSATTPGAAVAGTIAVSTGKWVWEVTAGSATYEHGLALADSNIISGTYATYNFARIVFLNGNKRIGSASSTAYGTGATAGDVYRFEADLDNGTLVVFKNNSSLGTLHSWTPTGALLVPHADYSTTPGAADSYNFGQGNVASATWDSASGGYFKNTPTSGFKALCTANLPAGSVTTSGSFTGNSATDGPFVWLNGSPTAMTINGNAVTFGTHADKTAGGFKLRTSSSSYNASGSNTYSITTNAGVFGDVNHAPQTAKGNP